MPGQYRYLACDILTGDILHELPLTGAAMQTRLGGGTFSAVLPLVGRDGLLPEIQRRDLLGYTVPLATSVVAVRDGQVAGEWQITKRTRPLGDAPVSLEGVEILGHLGRRFVTGETYGTVSSNGTENGVDQFTIARSLFSTGLGGIRVDLGSNLSGVTKVRNEWAAGSKTCEDALAEIAATIDGFDYWIETANLNPDGLSFARFLRLASPRAGTDRSDSIVFDVASPASPGGSVAAFGGLVEDGELLANRTIAVGKDGMTATASVPAWTVGGRPMPVTERTGSWSSVSTASVLQAHADALLSDSASLFGPPTLTVLADGVPTDDGGHTGPALGDWRLGDRVALRAGPSAAFPDGIAQTVRVIGWTLTPADGPEVVALEIDWTDKPNATAPRDLVALLAQTRRRLRDLETH